MIRAEGNDTILTRDMRTARNSFVLFKLTRQASILRRKTCAHHAEVAVMDAKATKENYRRLIILRRKTCAHDAEVALRPPKDAKAAKEKHMRFSDAKPARITQRSHYGPERTQWREKTQTLHIQEE